MITNADVVTGIWHGKFRGRVGPFVSFKQFSGGPNSAAR